MNQEKSSWAIRFSDQISPSIKEERFSVLYSDIASRPNTPVNVIVEETQKQKGILYMRHGIRMTIRRWHWINCKEAYLR